MIYSSCKTKIIALLILLALINTALAQNITENKLETELAMNLKLVTTKVYCSCGCGYILDTCDCDTAISMIREINTKLEKGDTPNQVLLYLASVYGPSILIESKKGKPPSEQKEQRNNMESLPFQILGLSGALYIAYKLGQRSKRDDARESQDRNWNLKEGKR
jgi:cytochrome c-type biogenesis protein CcmH/NrfF